jgi:hypothetical protein
MKNLPDLTAAQEKRLWREARQEFPGDEMMAEIHFVRRKLQLQMKDLSPQERIKYYNDAGTTSKEQGRKRKTG